MVINYAIPKGVPVYLFNLFPFFLSVLLHWQSPADPVVGL